MVTDLNPWYRAAACSGTDPELFHPDSESPAAQQDAKELCAACPVRETCLDEALAEEAGLGLTSRFGIRGGMSRRQRVREDARRRGVTPAPKRRRASTKPKCTKFMPKLTPEQREEMRRLWTDEGFTQIALSRRFGVAPKTVRRTLGLEP